MQVRTMSSADVVFSSLFKMGVVAFPHLASCWCRINEKAFWNAKGPWRPQERGISWKVIKYLPKAPNLCTFRNSDLKIIFVYIKGPNVPYSSKKKPNFNQGMIIRDWFISETLQSTFARRKLAVKLSEMTLCHTVVLYDSSLYYPHPETNPPIL